MSAQSVGESLHRLEKEKGRLIPADVVEAARPVSSPMHSAFDWEDSVAAEKWRLDQAKGLIRSVIYVSAPAGETPKELRAFVSVPTPTTPEGRAYENIVSVMSDKEKRTLVLKRAYAELVSWRDRYRNLVEFSELFDVIDDIEIVDPVVFAEKETKEAPARKR